MTPIDEIRLALSKETTHKVKSGLGGKYAMPRKLQQIPVRLKDGKTISLSPGKHSELIKRIIEEFGSRFVPDGVLAYAGDTGEKWGCF